MQECKYNNDKTANGIIHKNCSNEEMKKINHSKDDIPCMGKNCGMFEKKMVLLNQNKITMEVSV